MHIFQICILQLYYSDFTTIYANVLMFMKVQVVKEVQTNNVYALKTLKKSEMLSQENVSAVKSWNIYGTCNLILSYMDLR